VEILPANWPGPGPVGTGFFIEPHHIATAAHVVEGFMSGRWDPRVLTTDRVRHELGDVIRYSADTDFVVLSLIPDRAGTPLEPVPSTPRRGTAIQVAGHFGGSGIALAEGGEYLQRSGEWSTFRSLVWVGLSGGPLFEKMSGKAIGMVVEARPREGLSRAVPIETLLARGDGSATITSASAFDPLGMGTLSASAASEHVTLPLPFRAFANEVRARRDALYDSVFSQYASAPREAFVLTGKWAPESCFVLNGEKCSCPATSASDALRLEAPKPAGGPFRNLRKRREILDSIEGAVIVRDRPMAGAPSRTLVNDAALHLDLARRGLMERKLWERIVVRDEGVFSATVEPKLSGESYEDKQGRMWVKRSWSLPDTDFVIVSMGRDLSDSHVVLMQAVPQAYEHGAWRQVELVADYGYACAGDR
jgi:hypothetical protein